MKKKTFPSPARGVALGAFEVVIFDLNAAAEYIAAGWPYRERPGGTFVFPATLLPHIQQEALQLAERRETQPTRHESVTSRRYLPRPWR
jgi:hypothetical protein